MSKSYDHLIIGAGLFWVIFAYETKKRGKKSLVIDWINHIGGNVYWENIEDINIHKYGAHIFHTSNKKVWEYVNQFVEFNRYTNSPIANYKGEIYNLPFNMNTFNKLWGVFKPEEAKIKMEEQNVFCKIKFPTFAKISPQAPVGNIMSTKSKAIWSSHDPYHMIQTSHLVSIIDNCSQEYILISAVTPLSSGLAQGTEANGNDAGAYRLSHLSSVRHKIYWPILKIQYLY